jgi:hypothetical protein
VTFILAALLIVIFTTTAVVAKSPKVKRTALVGLIVVLAALCGLLVLAYAHVAIYAGRVFWPWPTLDSVSFALLRDGLRDHVFEKAKSCSVRS